MLEIITDACDILCPIGDVHIQEDVPNYVTADIIDLIQQKKALSKLVADDNSVENCTALRDCKRVLRKNLEKARRNQILSTLEENRSDPRKFWRVINKNFGVGKSKIRSDLGRINEEVGDFLSSYYAQNGIKLAEKFNNDWDPSVLEVPWLQKEFVFDFVPMNIVQTLIKEIDIYKSSGIENINARVLKDSFTVLYVELTHLFNESLGTGVFPEDWTLGNITPIPKEGDILEANNWRPVTILPLPSKLLEKAVHFQLSNCLSINKILSDKQHGFRPGYSTSTAIFKVVKNLFENYNNNESTICAFIDYRKAFETLDHAILLSKLSKIGLGDGAIKWMESYLNNRRHRVVCNRTPSTISKVPYGVPQGSVFGPLLFIIYVNDLLHSLEKIQDVYIEMYADDTVIYTRNADVSIATSKMEKALLNLQTWCDLNK